MSETVAESTDLKAYTPLPYKKQLFWQQFLFLITMHLFGLIGLYHLSLVHWATYQFALALGMATILSVSAGAHRLWSHRSYTATLSLRLFLLGFFTCAFQGPVHEWVRDHRGHHKWVDSDADPYNARRGFFFSHMGWLALKKHPEVVRKGRTIDMSDIEGDPWLAFQKRHYYALVLLFWGLIPTAIPVLLWGETVANSALVCVFYRTLLILHATWMINSWAHLFGDRPFDKRISPVNISAVIIRHLMIVGDGFHNYHHTFPWDYSSSELGPFDVCNPSTAFINAAAALGFASNLKRVNDSLVEAKSLSKGDGSKRANGFSLIEWLGAMATYLVAYQGLPLGVSHLLRAICS